jgi:ubiquinone/menaquinone biosynthesis C-methylase UbiE
MSALKQFPLRIPEPKAMEKVEMGVFDEVSRSNYRRWFIPLVDDFIVRTKFSHGKILDVACGPGLLVNELALRSPKALITGLDISKEALHLAKRNTAKHSNVTYKLGSVYNLPFDSGSFDAVITKDSLHHFDKGTEAIAEMLRVLKPGGYLYIQDMRRDLPDYLIARSTPPQNAFQELQYYSTRAAYTKSEARSLFPKNMRNRIYLATQRISPAKARTYEKIGIDITKLREGLQARYNLCVRKQQ